MPARVLYAATDFCVCPECRNTLTSEAAGLRCTGCGVVYPVKNGIPLLLPPNETDERRRYRENYERIADDDLAKPLEAFRDARHSGFLKFIGSQRGKRLLDVGSSNGLYLERTGADFKVALDLALPYLEALPPSATTTRICADAEYLPIKPGFFESIVVSDVLEHLLEPENLVERLRSISQSKTAIYVHVPWEENLDSYSSSQYKYTHLRKFDSYSFARLFKDFDVERIVASTPDLEQPLLFRLQDRLPRGVYNRLASQYFEQPGRAERDLAWRRSRMARLPRGEWWLLRFFNPKFKMFRLRARRSPSVSINRLDGQSETSDAGRILMLVPHEPELDPRVIWTAQLCASIRQTHVLGATSSNEKSARQFIDGAFVERVNLAETASARALHRAERWAGLGRRKPALEYVARAGAKPSRLTPRAWFRHQIGAMERFVSAVFWYQLLGDSLWRRARSVSVPPSVVVCHDLYALRAALRIKARWGSRILYDSHEYWPEADLMAQPWERALTKAYERRLIRKADAVVTVSEPLAKQLKRVYRLRNVTSVPNACPRHLGVVSSAERPLVLPIRVLVQGRATPRRGFEELLNAWREFNDDRAILEFRCPDSAYLEDLKASYKDLTEAGRLRFLAAVTEDELVAAAAQSDIGVIPYTGQTLNHVFACPNKLAQYMHAGLAILSNDLTFVRSLLEQYECGLVYDATRPETLVRAMTTLVSDLDLLQRMKEASTLHAAEEFNWEIQSRPYRAEINRLVMAPAAR